VEENNNSLEDCLGEDKVLWVGMFHKNV
jgi:hypothetical protein